MTIGAAVTKYRTAKGMTQEELAKRVDVSQTAISRLEKNSRIPSFEIMAQIADVLGCSLDDFCSRKEADE